MIETNNQYRKVKSINRGRKALLCSIAAISLTGLAGIVAKSELAVKISAAASYGIIPLAAYQMYRENGLLRNGNYQLARK